MTRVLIVAIVLFVAIFTVGTALTQVQPGERAVIRRWGRILPEHPGPGLHIGLPWGIDRVDRVPIGSVRRVIVGFRDDANDAATPEGQLLTGDHNLVNAQAQIDYVVREDQLADYALIADRADALVARAAESALAEWIAGRTVDEALLRGKAILPTVLIADINRRLDGVRAGVRVEQVSLPRLNPPDDVREAFEAVAKAKTEQQTQINQAIERASRIQGEANAEKFRLEQGANAYAHEQLLQARAEADSYLTRLKQYRELAKKQPDYLNVLWQDEIARLFAKLRETGHVDLLDNHLGTDGLNITQMPTRKK